MQKKAYLQMKCITKKYPGVTALDEVDFESELGEVHALLGENGAGKSTLMNLLGGLIQPTQGEIFLQNNKVKIANPIESYNLGIGFVHQESNLLNNLTVCENVFLAHEVTGKLGALNHKEMRQKFDDVNKKYGYTLIADALVENLKLADKQLVEIARALLMEPKILIMDEPTASLTEQEVQRLFEIIRRLKANDVCVIYISHRLDEIMEIADRVTVLKDGKNAGELTREEIEKEKMISMMVGRNLENIYPNRTNAEIGEVVLEANNLSITNCVENISFKVRAGEIYGFGGLDGQGQREVARAIFGELPFYKGSIMAAGTRYAAGTKGIAAHIKGKIAYVTHDRHGEGLILHQSITKNTSMPVVNAFKKLFGKISIQEEKAAVQKNTDLLDLKAFSLEQTAGTLSGGNQQKIMLARWLMVQPKVLVIDEPTKGVDVGARVALYHIINQLTQQGVAVIVLTSDMPELIGLSDRILVFYEGRAVAEIPREAAGEEAIMQAASGMADERWRI